MLSAVSMAAAPASEADSCRWLWQPWLLGWGLRPQTKGGSVVMCTPLSHRQDVLGPHAPGARGTNSESRGVRMDFTHRASE